MLILLSPAKTMEMSELRPDIPSTDPDFGAEAEELAARMRTYTAAQLEKLLKTSPALAAVAYARYRDFDAPSTPAKQALWAYDGSVFRHLNPEAFTPDDILYAQHRLRIVSTLYGLVRPLDRIKAYRIAFSLRLDGMKGNLYDYWFAKLTDPLIAAVRDAGGILVNLASLDVLKSLDMPRIEKAVRIVTPEFMEYRSGRCETIRTYAKMARGEMAGYIIRNRIEHPEELKSFEWSGFAFDPSVSDDHRYVFTRRSSASG